MCSELILLILNVLNIKYQNCLHSLKRMYSWNFNLITFPNFPGFHRQALCLNSCTGWSSVTNESGMILCSTSQDERNFLKQVIKRMKEDNPAQYLAHYKNLININYNFIPKKTVLCFSLVYHYFLLHLNGMMYVNHLALCLAVSGI